MPRLNPKGSRSEIESFIDAGNELIRSSLSAGAGAVVGFAVGGPLGAFAGSALGAAIETTYKIVVTNISKRQKARMGALTVFAIEKGQEYAQKGLSLRAEFGSGRSKRNASIELLEALYQRARDSYEERKIPYLGCFYANIAYRDSIGLPEGHFLLGVFSRMTYRQICILSTIHNKHFGSPRCLDPEQWTIVQEIADLQTLGLLERPSRLDDKGLMNPEKLVFSNLHVTKAGENFVDYFDIDRIPIDDIVDATNEFFT